MGVQPAGHAAAQPEGLMRRGSMAMVYVGIVILIPPPLLFHLRVHVAAGRPRAVVATACGVVATAARMPGLARAARDQAALLVLLLLTRYIIYLEQSIHD